MRIGERVPIVTALVTNSALSAKRFMSDDRMLTRTWQPHALAGQVYSVNPTVITVRFDLTVLGVDGIGDGLRGVIIHLLVSKASGTNAQGLYPWLA